MKSRQDLTMGYRNDYRDECTSAPDIAACERSIRAALMRQAFAAAVILGARIYHQRDIATTASRDIRFRPLLFINARRSCEACVSDGMYLWAWHGRAAARCAVLSPVQ